MNILFVHHGTISANSMNHIGPFADELNKQGHEVVVAVPELDPSLNFFPYPRVIILPFEDLLENPNRFEGAAPDIVHAWTPREIVRQFCEKLWQKIQTRWVIHLEDDENAVRQSAQLSKEDLLHRTDPLHGPWFMELADGYSLIIDSLAIDLPREKLFQTLYPGFDLQAARENTEPPLTKATFSIPENFKVITYPGAASGANAEDLVDLYKAIHLLNEHGTPCILLKTGFPDAEIRQSLPAGAENWIRDVGYLPREQLWRLIELANVVVQPGRINQYNENRLPSKLPDFLCLGKPLVTSTANLGRKLIDGEDALILKESTPEEIAARCQELFSNPKLARKIAQNGKKKGREWFDLRKNTQGLVEFYDRILETPPNALSTPSGNHLDKALESLEAELATIQEPSDEALKIRTYLRDILKSQIPAKPRKLKSANPQIEFQVYYPHDPAKLELNSLRRWYQPDALNSCLFPFSPNENLDWLRIDPGQYPGNYLLKTWALLDKNQNPLLEWSPESSEEITCQLNGATLGPLSENGQEIWSLTHDPQLLFAPLPSLDSTKIRWFKVEFSANEIESPRTQKLTLKRKKDAGEVLAEKMCFNRIDSLLAKLERRRSPILRFLDRFRKR